MSHYKNKLKLLPLPFLTIGLISSSYAGNIANATILGEYDHIDTSTSSSMEQIYRSKNVISTEKSSKRTELELPNKYFAERYKENIHLISYESKPKKLITAHWDHKEHPKKNIPDLNEIYICPCSTIFNDIKMTSPPWPDTELKLEYNREENSCHLSDANELAKETSYLFVYSTKKDNKTIIRCGAKIDQEEKIIEASYSKPSLEICFSFLKYKARDWLKFNKPIYKINVIPDNEDDLPIELRDIDNLVCR